MAQVEVTTPQCPVCKQASKLTVDGDSLKRWHEGELIQHAFWMLDNDTREILLTGTHPKCWVKMFADEVEW